MKKVIFENIPFDGSYWWRWTIFQFGKFITVILITRIKKTYLWWIFTIVIKIYLHDEISPLRPNLKNIFQFVTAMQMDQCNENSLSDMKIDHCNEKDKVLSQYWKFSHGYELIKAMKFYNCIEKPSLKLRMNTVMEIHH